MIRVSAHAGRNADNQKRAVSQPWGPLARSERVQAAVTRQLLWINSGNDVRQKLIFQRRDPILEHQLFPLQSRNLELISKRLLLKPGDLGIEVAMLGTELHQQLTNVSFVLTLHACAIG